MNAGGFQHLQKKLKAVGGMYSIGYPCIKSISSD